MTFSSMIGIIVSDLASGIIQVQTLVARFKRPNTATLPDAPYPRLPLRTPPK